MQLLYGMVVQNNNFGTNRSIHELNFRATKEFDHYRLLSDLRLGILGCGDIGGESKCYKLTLGDNHSITVSGGSRIFPRRGRQLHRGVRQHTILPKFPKNCMKLKEFGPGGGARPSRPPEIRH